MKKVSDIISGVFITSMLIVSLVLTGCFIYQQSEKQKESSIFINKSCCTLMPVGVRNIHSCSEQIAQN